MLVISLTLVIKMKVEHFISKRAHKLVSLRFWIKMGCLPRLRGYFFPNVHGPPSSPRDHYSGIRAEVQ